MARNYMVGHGKPPKAGRFKKGRSGNPKGRPKGSRNLASELRDELKEQIVVRENGVARKVTKQRGILKSVVAKGLSGDVKASATLFSLTQRFEQEAGPIVADQIEPDEIEDLRRFLPRLQKLLQPKGDDK